MRRLTFRRPVACPVLALLTLTVGAGESRAAGYALKEQSVTAQGNAFAGATSAAEDVSYMFFNPAALGWVDDVQLQAVATLLAPRSELESAEASTVLGTPIAGRDRDDDIGENAVLPSFYAAAPLPAGLRVGLGVNVPFGLETRYSRGWVGRYHAAGSELKRPTSTPRSLGGPWIGPRPASASRRSTSTAR
ncbi:MAG TPA: outer membrane protein transport protein [Geminicoccaceae bacterium]|nr:outer membrane protein transport protein [Geminicoccaceae bacterium]